jgi:hypothetical protein
MEVVVSCSRRHLGIRLWNVRENTEKNFLFCQRFELGNSEIRDKSVID